MLADQSNVALGGGFVLLAGYVVAMTLVFRKGRRRREEQERAED